MGSGHDVYCPAGFDQMGFNKSNIVKAREKKERGRERSTTAFIYDFE
jgi:hypothetical protein